MKKIFSTLVMTFCFSICFGANLKSLVFSPDVYYYGIGAPNKILVAQKNGVVIEDADFELVYHVNPASLSEEVLNRYKYSIIYKEDTFNSRAKSGTFNGLSQAPVYKSYKYNDGDLQVTATIKKGTLLNENAPLIKLQAEGEDSTIVSDYCTLYMEYAEGETVTQISNPVISYQNGTLHFQCNVEGATIHSNIENPDIKKYTSTDINLTGVYTITAYATKAGYKDSDTSTATLVWATGSLNPATSAKEISVDAMPLLITQNGGVVTVSGASDGETVSAYTVGGSSVAAGKVVNKSVTMDLSSISGQIVVLKVGGKSAKIMVK